MIPHGFHRRKLVRNKRTKTLDTLFKLTSIWNCLNFIILKVNSLWLDSYSVKGYRLIPCHMGSCYPIGGKPTVRYTITYPCLTLLILHECLSKIYGKQIKLFYIFCLWFRRSEFWKCTLYFRFFYTSTPCCLLALLKAHKNQVGSNAS